MNDDLLARVDKAECPKCNGLGGGYIRTGADDQWDSETCDWCFGTGYIPAGLAAAVRERDRQLEAAQARIVELRVQLIVARNPGIDPDEVRATLPPWIPVASTPPPEDP